jgi:hypothetical protein
MPVAGSWDRTLLLHRQAVPANFAAFSSETANPIRQTVGQLADSRWFARSASLIMTGME